MALRWMISASLGRKRERNCQEIVPSECQQEAPNNGKRGMAVRSGGERKTLKMKIVISSIFKRKGKGVSTILRGKSRHLIREGGRKS